MATDTEIKVCYEQAELEFRLSVVGSRFPINGCTNCEAARVRVEPNITEESRRRNVPFDFIADELYSYARHLISVEVGIPDASTWVVKKQSTGSYITVHYPKK